MEEFQPLALFDKTIQKLDRVNCADSAVIILNLVILVCLVIMMTPVMFRCLFSWIVACLCMPTTYRTIDY